MIYIKGEVPSSKNSKIKAKNGIFHSKTVSAYLRMHGIKSYSASRREIDTYVRRPCTFPFDALRREFAGTARPIIAGFHFIRGTRRKADFHNLVQLICDLMTAGEVIPEDDMSVFFPAPARVNGKLFSYRKGDPGLLIGRIDEKRFGDFF